MATIVYPYTPVDGATLLPEQLGRCIHSPADTESLLGEINGNLDDTNLDATFRLARRHVASRDLNRVEGLSEGGLLTLHLDSRAFSSAPTNPRYITVAGLGLRWYQPWAATCLCTWDYFLSVWKMWKGPTANPTAAAAIILQATLDQAVCQGTVCRVPETAWSLSPSGNNYIESRESTNAQWRSQAFLVPSLAAGWHEITYRCWIEADSYLDSIEWPSTMPGHAADPAYHAARVTIGHRHPQVLLLT